MDEDLQQYKRWRVRRQLYQHLLVTRQLSCFHLQPDFSPDATYLLKSLQGFMDKGIIAYAIGIQNEPGYGDPTYPTCKFTPTQEANVGKALRSLMDSNGFGGTKIIAYEHNWDGGQQPIQILEEAASQFAGAAFHCYAGNVAQQNDFQTAFPSKEVYLTECSGIFSPDWWGHIKWWTDNL